MKDLVKANFMNRGGEHRERLALGLIAHDSKKEDMICLAKAHQKELARLNLIATRGTGQLIQSRVGLPVVLVQSGANGGDQQIGALIASEELDAVIFLRDALTAHSHEPDVSALLRVCDVHNVPLATNLATAEAVLHLLLGYPEAVEEHHLAAEEEVAAVPEIV
jgi:methylglyoxal synthase